MNPLIKTMVASGAIAHRRFVAFTATDGQVVQADAATDIIAGVADCPGGAVDGGRIDIVMFGPADIDVGGTIAAGVPITSDANGKAVAAAPAAGVVNAIGGHLLAAAVSGDIAKGLVNISRLTGAA